MQECLLPHYNERRTPVDMLVLHATCHADADEVFESLDKLELSCHYFVDLNGRITRMVDEQKRAWHAGAGYWQGIDTDLNSHSIGIEIGNLSLGQQDFAEAQIEKLIPFCRKLINKYNLHPRRIVAHSDIAPTRKPDPGIRFPWKRLAREGIGLWYQLRNAEKIGVDDPAELLKIIGYDTRDEEKTIASAYAFRRRFLPQEVAVDPDIKHLVDNVYPIGRRELLQGEKFIRTLKAVAYSYAGKS